MGAPTLGYSAEVATQPEYKMQLVLETHAPNFLRCEGKAVKDVSSIRQKRTLEGLEISRPGEVPGPLTHCIQKSLRIKFKQGARAR